MRKFYVFLLLGVSLVLTGCDTTTDNVFDIVGNEEVVLFVGTDLPDLLDGVSMSGLADTTGYELGVDTSSVDVNAVDTYDVTFYIMFEDEKVYEETSEVIVTDSAVTNNPLIKGVTTLTHIIGEELPDFYDGITVDDKKFGDITPALTVDYSTVDFYSVGTYEVTYVVANNDGYFASASTTLDVVGGEDFVALPDEFFLVEQYHLWGIQSVDDEIIIPIEYDRIEYLGSNILALTKDKTVFYYNYDTATFFESDYYLFGEFSEGMITAYNDEEKFGYVDMEGNEVLPFIYSYATKFENGEAMVSISNNVGIIDTDGEMIIDIIYGSISFYDDYYKLYLNGTYTYLSLDKEVLFEEGNIELNPIDGMDNYYYFSSGSYTGIVDNNYNIIIPAMYYTYEFIDGVIIATDINGLFDFYTEAGANLYNGSDYYYEYSDLLKIGKDGRYGFIDKTSSSLKFGPEYKYLRVLSNNSFIVRDDQYNYGMVNALNEIILPLEYRSSNVVNNTELVMFLNYDAYDYDLVNYAGSVLSDTPIKSVGDFEDGLALVEDKNSLWGMIDENGAYALEPTYYELTKFENGYAKVRDTWSSYDSNMGIINTDFELVIPTEYYSIGEYQDGLFSVNTSYNVSASSGYINLDGEIIIPLTYEYASDFEDGVAAVRISSGVSNIINTSGETLMENDVYSVYDFQYGYSTVRSTSSWHSLCVVDSLGNIIGTCDKSYIHFLQENHFYVQDSNGNENLMKLDGTMVFDTYVHQVYMFNDSHVVTWDGGTYYKLFTTGGEFVMQSTGAITLGDNDIVTIYNNNTTKTSYYDVEGNKLFEDSYRIAHPFINGYAFVCEHYNSSCGVIDTDGNIMIDFNYTYKNVFSNKYYVENNYNQQTIEMTEDGLFMTIYDNEDTGEMLYAEVDGTWTLFNEDDDVLAMIDATDIRVYQDVLIIELDGLQGIANFEGDVLVDPLFDSVHYSPDYDYYRVMKDGNYGLVDTKRNVIVQPIYDNIIYNTEKQIAYTSIGSVYTVFDFDGNRILSFEYSSITHVEK